MQKILHCTQNDNCETREQTNFLSLRSRASPLRLGIEASEASRGSGNLFQSKIASSLTPRNDLRRDFQQAHLFVKGKS